MLLLREREYRIRFLGGDVTLRDTETMDSKYVLFDGEASYYSETPLSIPYLL
jgi:hypothetical protein